MEVWKSHTNTPTSNNVIMSSHLWILTPVYPVYHKLIRWKRYKVHSYRTGIEIVSQGWWAKLVSQSRTVFSPLVTDLEICRSRGNLIHIRADDIRQDHIFKSITFWQGSINYILYFVFVFNAFIAGLGVVNGKGPGSADQPTTTLPPSLWTNSTWKNNHLNVYNCCLLVIIHFNMLSYCQVMS